MIIRVIMVATAFRVALTYGINPNLNNSIKTKQWLTTPTARVWRRAAWVQSISIKPARKAVLSSGLEVWLRSVEVPEFGDDYRNSRFRLRTPNMEPLAVAAYPRSEFTHQGPANTRSSVIASCAVSSRMCGSRCFHR